MKGDYDPLLSTSTYGPQPAGPADNGGIAPYDLLRVTGTGGSSEYLQVDNVDHALNHASISTVKTSGSILGSTLTAAQAGVAAGKIGNVFRAGGYTVRVDFVNWER